MCIGHHIRPVKHEYIYKFVLLAFFRSLGPELHIHDLVLLVDVVDSTPFFPASLVIFCEIWA